MPKEAPMPLGRSQARSGHQQQAYAQNHQQPSSYHHLQQYHHLPRPPGYEYYSATAPYQNEAPQVPQAPTSSLRDGAAAYEHAVKMTAKYYAAPQGTGGFKLTAPYELRPASTQAPQTSVQLKTPYERTSHSTMAGYNRGSQSMASAQYDHKMSAYPPALPYERFSKKKLATHAPEKTAIVGGPYGTSRNDKKTLTSVYDRPVVPSTSYERLTSKVIVSSPMDVDKGTQNISYERHKAYRVSEYERRERHRRAVEGADRTEVQYERQYEVPVSSAYERLGAAPPPIPTIASNYERQAPPTSSYERHTSVNAAYERRAVFDRAYEAAAYERRLFPPTSAFSSLNHAYYTATANYSRGQERQVPADEFETKDVQTSSIYPAKPRMSLLTSPEYLSSLSRRSQQAEENNSRCGQASVIVPPSRSPADASTPRKRLREGGKPEPLPPLTIDTSMCSPKPDPEKPSIYMPTVEPISPTSPPDACADDGPDASSGAAPKSSAKDNLLHDISRVDREINKIEHHIFNLKRNQVELEQKAKKSIKTEPTDEAVEAPLPQHFSLSHKVYSENRRRAKEAHAALSHMGPPVDLPLYNQPSDMPVYQENRRKHLLFKGRLIAHLRRRRREKCCAEIKMAEDYARRTEAWNRLVEKMESSPERKRRDVENRELFEKTFPKIRKEREDRERFLRVGSRVKSDADLEEIMDNLHEQEMEVKKMRDYAAVPPMLLSAECRRCVYVNTNGFIEDFSSAYKDRRLINVWTDSEKDLFREKYLMYPKNFGAIAAFLERKSVSDCVQYYYLSKKTENYKRLLKKSGHKNKSGRSRNKPAAPPVEGQQSTHPCLTIAPRFQRDYKPDGAMGGTTGGAADALPSSAPADQPPSPASGVSPPPAPPPQEPVNQPVATNDRPTAPQPQAPAPSELPPPPDPTAPQSVPVAAPAQSAPISAPARSAPISAPARSAPILAPARSAPISAPARSAPISVAPPALKPIILPFPDIPIVVIDDSDDSNSSSHFPYIRK